MASKAFLMMMIGVVAAIATPAMAKEYVVGDDSGWTVDFDYKGWAAGKNFYVGDTLAFIYPVGVHNVIKANQTNFQVCDIPSENVPLTTGNDVITLKAPGKKWYVCGVGNHCARGMKLAINVWEAPISAPAPSPVYRTWADNKGWFSRFLMNF